MHIMDGTLSIQVTAAGTLLAGAGVAQGLRGLDPDRIPRVGVLAAVFFVGSLIQVPVGISSAHLLLNGLLGLLLGWAAAPALGAALLMQAIVFQFGGLASWGANTVTMAAPAIAVYYLFGPRLRRPCSPRRAFGLGAAAGAFGVLGSGFMLSASLYASGDEFFLPAVAVLVAHVPVMVVEGFVTGSAVSFIMRVKPELLGALPGSDLSTSPGPGAPDDSHPQGALDDGKE